MAPVLLGRSNKILPIPQCLIDQIQIQKPILVVVTDQILDHTLESSSA